MNDLIVNLRRFPVTIGTCLLALAATSSWWLGGDVSAYMMGGEFWRGQFWRPVTETLPHLSIFHLLFNLYWIWRFGTVLEGVYGSWKSLAIFTGLAASTCFISHAVFEDGVGLSGVGYGLFGLLWVLRKKDTRFRGAFEDAAAVLFVAWFFLCILLTWTHIMPVGNVAHFSGAVTGILLGHAVGNLSRRRRLFATALGVVCAAGLAGAFARSSPWAIEGGFSTAVFHPREKAFVISARARQALDRGDAGQAVLLSREAASIDPTNPWFAYVLSVALQSDGDLRGAEAALLDFLALSGGEKRFARQRAEALKILAGRARFRGDHKAGASLWRKALDLDREDAHAWNELGWCLLELGEKSEAESAFSRAVNLEPGNSAYRRDLEALRGKG